MSTNPLIARCSLLGTYERELAMSVNVGVFIDVSNLFYSARSMGVEVNYIRLLEHVTRNRHLIRASAYTGIDPENGSQRRFVDFLSANGYRVVCKDIQKHESGRIKADLDVEMTLDVYMMSDNFDVVVLVTGDGDFKRLVEVVQQKGVRVEIVGFGASTSSELIATADQFTEISTISEIFRNSSAPQPPNGEVPAAARDALNGSAFALNRPRPA
jgi:uncharacterized LabA/DUF88 family protein